MGDFVDRGFNSVETLLLLIALKVKTSMCRAGLVESWSYFSFSHLLFVYLFVRFDIPIEFI